MVGGCWVGYMQWNQFVAYLAFQQHALQRRDLSDDQAFLRREWVVVVGGFSFFPNDGGLKTGRGDATTSSGRNGDVRCHFLASFKKSSN